MFRLLQWVCGVCVSVLLVACAPGAAHREILLYSGTGTTASDVRAVERLLDAQNLGYATVSADELNAMSPAQFRAYRLLIVPGGNFEQMGNALTPGAAQRVREAVRGGLNYLGICAGAFIAGASPYNGFNLTDGVRFKFYVLEAQNIRKAAVGITLVGSPLAEHYWEDGPELSGWGEAVAKYPDGTPAVVQGHSGAGWVVLTGVHAEAPASWRSGMQFKTSVADDNALALRLIDAAMNAKRLPHF